MNSRERIDAVVKLEMPDRVPVGPLLDHYAATYAGISNAELMRNGKKRIEAVLRTMKELGPWDITFVAETVNTGLLKLGLPMKLKQPGIDLPANEMHQFDEREVLEVKDYDRLIERGMSRFVMRTAKRLYPNFGTLKVVRLVASSTLELRKHRQMVEAAGAVMASSFTYMPMYEYFSLGRSLNKMSVDTFKQRDKIKQASEVWRKGMTATAIRTAKVVGCPRVFIGLARSSSTFISPRNFEELVLPELLYVTNHMVEAGITPLLHCDTDWIKALPLFRKLPAKKCILELDGFTDIFKAKEIVGDMMCIMGDVPSMLLARASKDEVLQYCRRLITEVGKGGGFILSSGCSIPTSAKAENVKALAEAVSEWGRYSRG